MQEFLEKYLSANKINKSDLKVLLHLLKLANNDLSQVIKVNQVSLSSEMKLKQPSISKSLKFLHDEGFIVYERHTVKFAFLNE